NEGRLFARQDLAFEDYLSDVKPVAQQVSQVAAREGNTANHLACLQRPHLGDDAQFAQVHHQQVEAAELEIAAEDCPDTVSFGFIDGNLPVFGFVAQRHHAANPK